MGNLVHPASVMAKKHHTEILWIKGVCGCEINRIFMHLIYPTLMPSKNLSTRVRPVGNDQQLIEMWLQGKSEHSQDAYKRDIAQFLHFVELPLQEVTLQHCWDWLNHLKDKGAKQSTQSRKIGALKSLITFGFRLGYLPVNVVSTVSVKTQDNDLVDKILSEEEVRDIIKWASPLRNYVLLKILYATGARVSELVQLRWKHVIPREDNKRGQVTLYGKGEKTRVVLVPPPVWAELMKLKSETDFSELDDPVFASPKGTAITRGHIYTIVRGAAEKAGVKKEVSPHWLRHAHASHALDQGAPIHLVKDTLGHASLSTTTKYTHARPTESSSNYLKF